jgi:hypothetical protein
MFAQKALSLRNYARVYTGYSRWHETEALLRGGDAERAAEDLRRMSGQLVDSPRYDLQHLCARAVLARWQGADEEAIAHLEAAGALAEQLGLLNERWQIAATLAEMHRTRGDEQRARRAFARAASIIRTFADKLADDHLRAAFLAARPVQRVLEAF